MLKAIKNLCENLETVTATPFILGYNVVTATPSILDYNVF